MERRLLERLTLVLLFPLFRGIQVVFAVPRGQIREAVIVNIWLAAAIGLIVCLVTWKLAGKRIEWVAAAATACIVAFLLRAAEGGPYFTSGPLTAVMVLSYDLVMWSMVALAALGTQRLLLRWIESRSQDRVRY